MQQIKIKLRKNALKRTIVVRIIFYTMLLFCSTFALYLLNMFIKQQNIRDVLSLVILIILAFFFQYLIYAISLKKKISYTNFKDTLLENELADIKSDITDHPIKFLFPEFDIFYKLEDSVIDKIDSHKLAKINYINIEKALQIEEKFKEFISDHLEDLLKYDLVIKMKRKGKAIFDDLIERYPSLEKLVQYADPAVVFNIEKIKGRKILIFDDSIHHSNSARNILDLLKSIGYKEILFLTVVAQKNSLESLKKEYPDVMFLQYEIKDEEEYKKFYADYMIGYLDHVNRSLENDHTLIKLKIDTLIKKEEFIEIFEENKNYIYEVERIVEKDNEYKISLECPWIYDEMKKPFFKGIKMDMVKIRFFIKLNQSTETVGTTDINLSPALIPREFEHDFCHKPKMKEICILDKLYLFNWNEILGNDNRRLIEFLEKKYGIDWVKTAKIEKSDDDKIINVFVENHSILLMLDEEETKLDIKIDDVSTDKFIAEMENGKLNIYNIIHNEIKNLICINCVISHLTNDFMNEFMKYFEIKLKEKKKATIIEKSISYPYPQEIYRLKLKI